MGMRRNRRWSFALRYRLLKINFRCRLTRFVLVRSKLVESLGSMFMSFTLMATSASLSPQGFCFLRHSFFHVYQAGCTE